jgi:uncharacterized membrane protein
MTRRRFTAQTVIARDPRDVFAWVSDHRNVPRVLEGVDRWEPLGERVRGEGARFDVSVHALGLALDAVLVLDLWDEPRAIGWRSLSGPVPQTGGWRLEPRPGGTELTLTIGYEPPGGLLGGLLASRVDRLLRGRLEQALERIRVALEEDG